MTKMMVLKSCDRRICSRYNTIVHLLEILKLTRAATAITGNNIQ